MIIPISCDGPVQEWGMVELQGKIEQQLDIPSGGALTVGTLVASKTVSVSWAASTLLQHQVELCLRGHCKLRFFC